MDYLYSLGRKERDPRYCRTHSFIANLFANTATSQSNADAWIYVAKAWAELADLKQRRLDEKLPEQSGNPKKPETSFPSPLRP